MNEIKGVGSSSPYEEFFNIRYTNIVKGFGILFMIASHLLNQKWMLFPDSIIDFEINKTFLSAIVAEGGDICIGIFAFITGYGWATSFYRKSRIERILSNRSGGVLELLDYIDIIFLSH